MTTTTTMMQQGFLGWSPNSSNQLLSRLSPQKPLKPNSLFKLFASVKGSDSNGGGFKREGCRDREFQLKLPAPPFDYQERIISTFPATAVLVVNGIMYGGPLKALAETCEANNDIFNMNMPLLLFVALVGATVGGLLARQRKEELQRLNEQLRQINTALRRQAKIESYAPSLSYAPVSGRIAETEVIVDPRKEDLIARLKNGKNFLRNQDPERAFSEFQSALELAQDLDDPIEKKKAARGLGASLQRQGKYREAIKYHNMVLKISKRVGEESGNTEAYGAIADCYTELGDLERAAKFYDEYISRLESD